MTDDQLREFIKELYKEVTEKINNKVEKDERMTTFGTLTLSMLDILLEADPQSTTHNLEDLIIKHVSKDDNINFDSMEKMQ